ncbi:hypothetical protein EC973_007485 [Apophysomyces ossiformis]|uniref:RhoGAP-domain-containing protein n=1 Tax=Apophysomyces ossiformis TaxID=679940 RepID=A0A8H7BXU2_9FUNG|nr:hypothetical protein EC973_007485 [Apophysomyces ossiformis]
MTVDQLRDRQNAMEEKVYRIWTVLSAFEESAAACISDMLVHVSEGSYVEGVKMADYFIIHVEVLFDAIDDLLNQYHAVAQDELCHQREAKMLCKKVSNFFALLSHTQESGLRRIGVTQELLSLVTGLAHYLKVLIRIALTGALRLEKQYDMKMTAISRFLSQLMELANKQRCFPAAPEPLMTFDFCQVCKQVCDDQCFKFQHYLWHDRCFACCKCCAPLRDQYREVSLDPSDQTLLCKHCATQTPGLRQGFEHVTQLQQYSFLLRVSLKRLYNLLNVNENAALYDRTDDRHAIQHNIHPPSEILTKDPYAASYPNGDKLAEKINLGDIKRMKSTHMKRKLTDSYRVAKRSTLMETPSPNAAYLTSQPDDQGIASGQQNDSCENFIANTEETTLANLHILGNEDALTLDDIPQLVAAQQQIQSSQGPTQHQQTQNYTKIKPDSKFYYFAELGALDHFMVKHIAVLYLEEIVKSYFTIEELADLIDDKKNSTLWGKFVAGLKAGGNKKAPRAKGKSTVTNTKRYNQSHTAALQNLEGTFGVPLDILVEKNGVESNLGAGPTRIRIPSFVDDSISAMKQMDMSIEGIFRKNGNIKRLKVTSEEIDKNPSGYQLINERPIQIAALTKKFLRELPDPLLTFKLHKLFIVAQKLETEAERKRVTHLACCLLPKPNRDTMEVLFLFMKWVATFAHIDEESGSKMDLLNLATVLAPNILYSKSKDPAKDESFAAIESVHMLLKYQEEFCTVPEDFVPMLKNLSYGEGDMERNVRDILKKCEVAMKLKKSHSAGNYPTMPPRQHSSPAAVPTSSSILQSPQQEYPAHYHLSTSPVDITYPPNSPNTSPYFLSSPSEQFPTQHSAPTHSGAASMLVSDALR